MVLVTSHKPNIPYFKVSYHKASCYSMAYLLTFLGHPGNPNLRVESHSQPLSTWNLDLLAQQDFQHICLWRFGPNKNVSKWRPPKKRWHGNDGFLEGNPKFWCYNKFGVHPPQKRYSINPFVILEMLHKKQESIWKWHSVWIGSKDAEVDNRKLWWTMWHWCHIFLYEIIRSGLSISTPNPSVFSFFDKPTKNAAHFTPLRDPTVILDISWIFLTSFSLPFFFVAENFGQVDASPRQCWTSLKIFWASWRCCSQSWIQGNAVQNRANLLSDVMSFEGSNHLDLWERNHPWIF